MPPTLLHILPCKTPCDFWRSAAWYVYATDVAQVARRLAIAFVVGNACGLCVQILSSRNTTFMQHIPSAVADLRSPMVQAPGHGAN